MLLAGEAEMARDRYYQAYEWFERQLANYPNGQYYQRALNREYAIADAFLEGKPRIALGFIRLPAQPEGLMILDRIVEHAPASVLAEKALLRKADYHVNRKEWDEAREAFDRFLELFPKSARAPEAAFSAAQAMLGSYKGPSHDPTPLAEAQSRFEVIQREYPELAARRDVARTLQTIRELRAQKDYDTARFYERVGKKGPAKFYYRQVRRQYPGSDYAEKAAKRLEKLGGGDEE